MSFVPGPFFSVGSQVVLWAMATAVAIFGGIKFRTLRRARTSSRQFAPIVAGAMRRRDYDTAEKIAAQYETEGSHLARVVKAGMERARVCGKELTNQDIDAIRSRMEYEEMYISHDLRDWLGVLDVKARPRRLWVRSVEPQHRSPLAR